MMTALRVAIIEGIVSSTRMTLRQATVSLVDLEFRSGLDVEKEMPVGCGRCCVVLAGRFYGECIGHELMAEHELYLMTLDSCEDSWLSQE